MTLEPILEVCHLSKSFGTHQVLRDVNFTVHPGDVTSILGSSGSGKSTLLRCINLLETPTSGEILYRGQNVTGPKVNAPQYRSHVGMVFQSFALWPHMTVREHVEFPLNSKRCTMTEEEKRKAVDQAIEAVGLSTMEKRYPGELSGGQKAKLFFLKMILDGANVLVLDEPTRNFSPLSGPVIRGILEDFPGCIISVSHDRKYIGQVCSTLYRLEPSGLAPMENLWRERP